MMEWQIVFSLVFALTGGHALAAIALFVWRRHEHPLTGHSLPLMFLTAGAACNPLVISAVYARIRVLCWQYVLFGYGPGIACCVTYCVRAWRIFIYYDIQQKKIDGFGSASPDVDTNSPNQHRRVTQQMDDTTSSSNSNSVTTTPQSGSGSDDVRLNVYASGPAHQSGGNTATAAANRNRRASSAAATAAYTSKYLMRVSKWCTDRNFFLLALGVSLVFTLALFIPLLVDDNFSFSDEFSPDTNVVCPNIANSTRVAMGTVGLTFAIVIYTAWKLRFTFDGYMIKWELKYSATWGCVVLLLMAIDGRLGNIEVVQLFKNIMVNAVVYQALTWKILASYGLAGGRLVKEQVSKSREMRSTQTSVEHTLSSANSKRCRLRDILDDPAGRDLFIEHLKREWSVENILFYSMARIYREYPFHTAAERSAMAVDIFNQYLADNAYTEVNLPAAIRDPIKEQISAWQKAVDQGQGEPVPISIEVFEVASRNIYNLMKSDSFQRFQLTRAFREHVSQQEEEERGDSAFGRLLSCSCCFGGGTSKSKSKSKSAGSSRALTSKSKSKSKSESSKSIFKSELTFTRPSGSEMDSTFSKTRQPQSPSSKNRPQPQSPSSKHRPQPQV